MKITVQAWEKGLKFRDGKFVGVLEPGRHRLARWLAKDEVLKLDLRVQALTIQGQEILTADKITVRLTVLAKYRVADPVAALMKVDDYVGRLYGDVQLALREAVAARTLDELIVEKAAMGAKVLGALQMTAAYGLRVEDTATVQIRLPRAIRKKLKRMEV